VQVAQPTDGCSHEELSSPFRADNSWQVILKDDGKPEWITVEKGEITVAAEKEPMTSAARRPKQMPWQSCRTIHSSKASAL
jgi:hypothetical protein